MKTLKSLKEEVENRLNQKESGDNSVLVPHNWHKQIAGMDKDRENKGLLFYLDVQQGEHNFRIERVMIDMSDMTYTSDELEINEWKNKFFPQAK